MDYFALGNSELVEINGDTEGVGTNSMAICNPQSDLISHEGNNSNNIEAVPTNKTDEEKPINFLNVPWPNLVEVTSPQSTTNNSGAPHIQYVPGTPIVTSQSLMDILAYNTSSEDSEPDSVGFIDGSKSSDSSDAEWEELPSSNINSTRNYRGSRSATTDNSSDSASSDNELEIGATGAVKPIAKKSIRTEGELELDELPPVPDLSKLTINVKTEDCIQMGKITNIIDRLVTIESLPNTPAYDLDTLLFLDQGKVPLGYVYDVIGPVNSPIYVVRFNSKEAIESKGVTKGLPVYSAPNSSEHTQFVFLKELLRMRGSDASWQGDNEVPLEFLDFSDDEIEVDTSKLSNPNKKVTQVRKKKRNSRDRHRLFETTMNLKNQINSAHYKVRDQIQPMINRDVPKRNPKLYYHHPPPPCHVRPPLTSNFGSYLRNIAIPSSFNIINMPPPLFDASNYSMLQFPPNLQFPPPTFGSPAIPPLPHSQHVPAQPIPPGYPGSLPILQPGMPGAVIKKNPMKTRFLNKHLKK